MKSQDHVFKYRVVTMLDRNEIDFLDKVGKDSLFSTGHKLSYNDILKGFVEIAMEVGLTGDNVDSTQSLKTKMLEYISGSIKKN